MTREEAIERIKARFDKWALDNEDTKAIQALLPEFKESEDERIIKTLQEYVKNRNWMLNGPSQHEVLAWLEKQKERGPLTKEEEYILHRIIEYLEDETCPSEWISLLHDIYCLPYEKQKEQKPWKVGANAYFTPEQKPVEYLDKDKVYAIMKKLHELAFSQLIPINSEEYKKINEITTDVRDLLDYPIEQKPAEWNPSNEDVVLFNKAVTTNTNLTPSERAKLDIIRMKFKHCNGNITKPAEWSEEDEKILNELITIMDGGKVTSGTYLSEYVAWLKSLRPCWKPSKEHIKVLEYYMHTLICTKNKEILFGLYEQLKKLM